MICVTVCGASCGNANGNHQHATTEYFCLIFWTKPRYQTRARPRIFNSMSICKVLFSKVFPVVHFSVLYSLKDHYEEALRRNDVKAIVVTGKSQFKKCLPLVVSTWQQWRHFPSFLSSRFLQFRLFTVEIFSTGKGGVFSGGLDINTFGAIQRNKGMVALFSNFFSYDYFTYNSNN